MFALLTIDVARDAVAAQFDYAEQPAPAATGPTPRAVRTRFALSVLLHRAADLVGPAEYSPAH